MSDRENAAKSDLRNANVDSHDVDNRETVAPSSGSSSASMTTGPFTSLPADFGRFRVLKVLGNGAMGTVYLAVDPNLNREVALKIPKADLSQDAMLWDRFQREARAVGDLNHPNICRMYEAGEVAGTHFFSMEYVDGTPLSDCITAEAPQRRVVGIISKLAMALAHAHDRGIIHRDLKPANVMLDSKGEPKLMDFGLARRLDVLGDVRATQSGMIVGSPAYMAPEQAAGEPDKIGTRTDIYGLGVLFFELLTGSLPFQGSMIAVLGQITTKLPPKLSSLRPNVSPILESLCLKMLSKKPEDRPSSMASVVESLAKWLATQGTTPGKMDGERLAATESQVRPKPTAPKMPAADPIETQKQKVNELLEKHRYAAAIELLEKIVNLRDARFESLVVWGRKKLPEIRQIEQKMREASAPLCETAEKLLKRRDFGEAVKILSSVPSQYRSEDLREILRQATELNDECNLLQQGIEQAIQDGDEDALPALIKQLLKLKPGSQSVKRLAEDLKKYGARKVIANRRSGRKKFDLSEERTFEPKQVIGSIAIIIGLFVGTSLLIRHYLATTSPPDVTVKNSLETFPSPSDEDSKRNAMAVTSNGNAVKPSPVITPTDLRPGLIRVVFEGVEFGNQIDSRIDRVVQWNADSNDVGGQLSASGVSARWLGILRIPESSKYTLYFDHDDGVRLWIDDKLSIDNWRKGTQQDKFDIELTEGDHNLKVEYFDETAPVNAVLSWQSPSIERETIPEYAFLHDAEVAKQLGAKSLDDVSADMKSPNRPSETSQSVVDGEWVDLLEWSEGVDWSTRGINWNDYVEGKPSRNGIKFKTVPSARFPISAILDGDFEMEVEFIRQSGNDAIAVYFPVGIHTMRLHLGSEGGTKSYLTYVDAKPYDQQPPTPIKNGEVYRVVIHSKHSGENASFAVDWNGMSDYIQWEGKYSALKNFETSHELSTTMIRRPWIGSDKNSVVFQKIRARSLSGSIRRDPPAETEREQNLKNGFVRLVEERGSGIEVHAWNFGVNSIPMDLAGIGTEGRWPMVTRDFKFCDSYIGAHAPSHVKCPIPANVKSFSVIGYNDSSRSDKYIVTIDGKQVYESNVTDLAVIKVDIPANSSMLDLVTDPFDDSAYDHTYWCNARFHTVPADQITDEMLDDKRPSIRINQQMSTAEGGVTRDKPISQTKSAPIRFRDYQPCDEFLFAHAPSKVTYQVPQGITRFSAIGLNLISHSAKFEVWANGKRIYESPAAGIVRMDVKLPQGTKAIELKTTDMGGGAGDQTIWCYPRLYEK